MTGSRDGGDDDDTHVAVQVTSLLVLGVGLAALFLGYEWFWLAFALGYAVVVPIVKLVADGLGDGDRSGHWTGNPQTHDYESTDGGADRSESKQDALDTLRERYARGDLTEEQFEQKVEALLETETPESARKRVERERGSERTGDAERETDRSERVGDATDASDAADPSLETDESA